MGTASGVVSIDPSGRGQFLVTSSTLRRSGPLQIVSLTDTHIRARAAGYERTLPVALKDNHMRLDVPQLGEIVLTRAQAAN